MNVLSLFDGMSCGLLAMIKAGVDVDRYVAYEIDKYAIQTSKYNFPMIEHRGDVFNADFIEFFGFDWIVGGESLHLLEHRTEKQSRNTSKWIGLGIIFTICKSNKRSKTKIFHI